MTWEQARDVENCRE